MDILSILLVALMALWGLWVIRYLIKHRGTGCCGREKSGCSGYCKSCGGCKKQN